MSKKQRYTASLHEVKLTEGPCEKVPGKLLEETGCYIDEGNNQLEVVFDKGLQMHAGQEYFIMVNFGLSCLVGQLLPEDDSTDGQITKLVYP